MFNYKTLLQQCLLAATLALCAAGAALAGPTYKVSVDTSALAGTTGFVDFSLVGAANSPLALATVSNFGGAYGAEADRFGAALGGIPGGFSLQSVPGDNYLTYATSFGGIYSFDVSFSGDYDTVAGMNGATFAFGLYNDSLTSYLLQASFDLQPGNGTDAASVTPIAASGAVDIAEVTAVPEPATWALMLMGVLMAGGMARRKR